MTKDEIRAKYARIPTDFSQIQMLKDQLLESGMLDVAQKNPENAGKVLGINEAGEIAPVSGGTKLYLHRMTPADNTRLLFVTSHDTLTSDALSVGVVFGAHIQISGPVDHLLSSENQPFGCFLRNVYGNVYRFMYNCWDKTNNTIVQAYFNVDNDMDDVVEL